MAKHLFLDDRFRESSEYSARGTPVDWRPPARDRQSYGEYLQRKLEDAWREAGARRPDVSALALPEALGVYLTFRLAAKSEAQVAKLERMPRDLSQHGVRLRNVRYEDRGGQTHVVATVWVPNAKRGFFLRKVRDYLDPTKDSRRGVPKNRDLIACIEDIEASMLEAFWPEYDTRAIPGEQPEWCEAWLALETDGTEVEARFREIASRLEIQVSHQSVDFPERRVLLTNANRAQLTQLITVSDDIAEFRAAHECAGFWMGETSIEQDEWVRDLLERITVPAKGAHAVCLLDSGVNRGHPLLEKVCAPGDCLAVEEDWHPHDDEQEGHGTKMAGLAVYGQLERALESNGAINLSHHLESVKLLPPRKAGGTPKELWGHYTQRAAYKIEQSRPHRPRLFCTSLTAKDDRTRGRPSSWSGAVDALASGAEDGHPRLLVLAAGNVVDEEMWLRYPESNLTDSVQDPAQAWNALTVGAFTEKVQFKQVDYPGHRALAEAGDLSPYSTTSLDWSKTWPIKPEIVMEGGNLLATPENGVTRCDDLDLLTTARNPTIKPFSTIRATSAASAQAAWMAAEIQAHYPNAWPETVRGLLIHSAEWIKAMLKNRLRGSTKEAYRQLLQTVGFGVPDLQRAISCGGSTLTLVSQQEIQPFGLDGTRARCNEMHLHRLPWPTEALKDLPPEARARVRVTLSYFVEPSPGEVGWKYRYRYQSHGLRFKMIKPGEAERAFVQRVNAAMEEEEAEVEAASARGQSDDRWLIGSQTCSRGSLHSDAWDDATAAAVASCQLIAVHPVIGWWRERKHLGRVEKKTRYSLIVTIKTPEQEVDLYTPVANLVAVKVEV